MFDKDVKGVIYREINEGIQNTWIDEIVGFVVEGKGVELYKPMTTQMHDMFINTRTLLRIYHIYEAGTDVRVNNLWDFIQDYQNEFSNHDTTCYCIEYSDDDLLR